MATDKCGGRRLGPSEALYQHVIDEYNALLYIHVAVINSSQKISADDVKKAFVILSDHQESLRMRVIQEEHEHLTFRFAPMEDPSKIDFKQAKLKEKNDWPGLVHEESQHRIDCHNGPLWKVTMAYVENVEIVNNLFPFQCVIFMKIHHGIADAKSGFDVIYRQFLPILSAVVNKGSTVSLLPKTPLSRSTQELFSSKSYTATEKPTVKWHLKLILDLIRWKNRNFGADACKNIFSFPDEPKKTENDILNEPNCYPMLLSEDLTSSVIHAAKRNGVTVHSVILGVTSLALCAAAEDAGVTLPNTIKQGWSIDLRKFLNWGTPQPLSSHTSGAETETNKKTDYTVGEFWKMCQNIHTGVKREGSKEKATALLDTAQYFLDVAKHTPVYVAIDECGLSAINGVSNVGNCDLGPEPKLTEGTAILDMDEQYFTVTHLRYFSTTPFFFAISTFKGRMAWNTTYDTRFVSKRFVVHYVKKILDVCWKFCGETPV